MSKEDLIKRLEEAYGCFIGSHTSNLTPENQLKDIIKDLKLEVSK